jgi:hypothetical protein
MGSPLLNARRLRPLVSLATRLLVALLGLALVFHLLHFQTAAPTDSKALVIATSTDTEKNTAWLTRVPLDWSIFRYVADAKSSALSVPVNKGNEAMVYLTYIIDHYDALPDVVLFHHDHYKAWHQNLDSVYEVSNLRTSYVMEKGYVSTRCLSSCENIIPLSGGVASTMDRLHLVPRDVQLHSFLLEFLGEGEKVPDKVAAPCCAQFAASRQAIRKRSLQWWKKMRQWLIDTPLPSQNSGRLLEYTWHIWLGEQAQ